MHHCVIVFLFTKCYPIMICCPTKIRFIQSKHKKSTQFPYIFRYSLLEPILARIPPLYNTHTRTQANARAHWHIHHHHPSSSSSSPQPLPFRHCSPLSSSALPACQKGTPILQARLPSSWTPYESQPPSYPTARAPYSRLQPWQPPLRPPGLPTSISCTRSSGSKQQS